jgi:hypothetical protein
MSNYMALATVTATLSQLVQEAINGHSMMPTVTHFRPDGTGLPTTGVNLFLYQVTPNAAWRNVDLPARDSAGRLITRPRVALDLHYLLTFYGDDATFEPQRLLGLTVSALHAKPILARDQITSAIAAASDVLEGSDLAQEVELVKFTPLPLSLEELSKLWSVFFQTHYTLSIAYHATVVLLDSTMVPVKSLPVRSRNFYSTPYQMIQVESVTSVDGATEPIFHDGTLLVKGRGLSGEGTKVFIDGEAYDPTTITDNEITFSLLDIPEESRRAGIRGLQIVRQVELGPVGFTTPHNSVQSNVVPFVLRPSIDEEDIVVTTNEILSTTAIHFGVAPTIREGQRVLVHLNQKGEDVPASYSYRVVIDEDTDVVEFTVEVGFFAEGDYLLRVQVDGAESMLGLSSETGLYDTPGLTI